MPQRKIWTTEEDRVLKFLYEQRGLKKWSQISRVMQEQFQILGRNGKQCRQRYHNHLDRNINNSEWTIQEENLLFGMQDQVGNKWALISSKLPGRTDNCVKNHFYSKLRKSLRNINKKIHKYMKKQYREIKTNVLYKIIQTMENKNKSISQNVQDDRYELCRQIKNELRQYEEELVKFEDINEELQFVRKIVEDIALFDIQIRKSNKKPNLKSSGKISEDSHKNSNVVSSTKSIYDDQSQSYSNNSELFSSSSFDHRTIHSSQHLLKPNKIFRSQSIPSQSENDSQQEVALHKSAKNIFKSAKLPQIKQEPMKKENSFASQHSNNSKTSQNNNQSNRLYMFEQISLQMRVIAPKQLTFEQKMEIHEDNDLLFFGDMDIQQVGLAKDFSQMGLGLTIPKLGKEQDF